MNEAIRAVLPRTSLTAEGSSKGGPSGVFGYVTARTARRSTQPRFGGRAFPVAPRFAIAFPRGGDAPSAIARAADRGAEPGVCRVARSLERRVRQEAWRRRRQRRRQRRR